MSEPFLAEVMIVGFNFAPRGYAQCDGQILPINQNQSLYSLLGRAYGGDGRTTFALPDLRGRVPIHVGDSGTSGSTSHARAQKAGEETVTLTDATLPAHQHTLSATSSDATLNSPTADANLLGKANIDMYANAGTNMTALNPGAISSSGNSAHENRQPWLAVNFVIAIQGIFPSRN